MVPLLYNDSFGRKRNLNYPERNNNRDNLGNTKFWKPFWYASKISEIS